MLPTVAPVVRFAAAELKHFLEAAVGSEVPIVNRVRPGVTAIVLGDNTLARSLDIDVTDLPRDGFIVKHVRPKGQDLILILGRDDPHADVNRLLRYGVSAQSFERGTLFAVYDFLERFLGVRFFFSNEFGTPVPKVDTLRVQSMEIFEAPDFTVRRVSISNGPLPSDMPADRDARRRAINLDLYRLRSETFTIPMTHGLARMGLVERFGKSHPEYFALLANGERDNHGGHLRGHLCLMNPGLQDEIFRDVVSYLQGRPAAERGILTSKNESGYDNGAFAPGYVSVMPQDGFGPKTFCHDRYCASYDNPQHRYEEYVWTFVNSIARRLKTHRVDGKITNLAYASYRAVPRQEIEDNVAVQLAVAGPWKEVAPTKQSQDDRLIGEWDRKLGGGRELSLWNYMNTDRNRTPTGTPALAPRNIAAYYKRNARRISGAYLQSLNDYRLFHYLNYYVFFKIAWDNETDVKELLRDHNEKMFGPGAAAMARFFDRLEELWATRGILEFDRSVQPRTITPTLDEVWDHIYGEKEIGKFEAWFDEAERLTEEVPEFSERVKYIRRHFLGEILNGRQAFYREKREIEDLALEALPVGGREIVVDGRLDDEVWLDAPRVYLTALDPLEDPKVLTTVMVRWTPSDLIVGFRAEEPLLDKMNVLKRRFDDPTIAGDNSVGVFLVEPTRRRGQVRIFVDPLGQVADGRTMPGEPVDWTWNSGARVEAAVGRNEWTAELAIPTEQVVSGIDGRNGSELAVNFVRGRRLRMSQKDDQLLSWSPFLRRGLDDPSRFGTLKLVARPTASNNLVVNGSMEETRGRPEKPAGWRIDEGAVIDRSTFRHGRQSIRMESDEYRTLMTAQNLVALKSNTRYVLTFFVKAENLEARPDAHYAGGVVNLTADANRFYPYGRFSGTIPWKKQAYAFTTKDEPPTKRVGRLRLGFKNARGRIWFDDVRLREVDESCCER